MQPIVPSARPSFMEGDNALARVAQSVARFLHVEAAGGLALLAATVAALVWANSPWDDSYVSFWSQHLHVELGDYVFDESLAHVVSDFLMAIFFLVVGMEVKRELVVGSLRNRRAVAVPALAALGGMVVPAMLYWLIAGGGEAARGWGIPMATDIAFALGVLAVLGSRVPHPLKVFLLTLAIIDDIGAIAVIAIFYADDIDVWWLMMAAAVSLLIAVAHWLRVTAPSVFVVLALATWLCVFESGVHATIAGVVVGLLTPARPFQTDLEAEQIVDVLENRPDLSPDDVRSVERLIRGSVSPCDRLIDILHPWTSYVIIPVFALATAGVSIDASSLSDPSRILIGVAVGLVVGKFTGILGFSALAIKLGLGVMPQDTRWVHLAGAAAIAGIGFTVSLFVTGLAFDAGSLQDDAKLGTFIGSALAAVIGVAVFVAARRQSRAVAGSPAVAMTQ